MERTITYQISESEHGLRVEQYLRHKGYSYQNLTQLLPESILIIYEDDLVLSHLFNCLWISNCGRNAYSSFAE